MYGLCGANICTVLIGLATCFGVNPIISQMSDSFSKGQECQSLDQEKLIKFLYIKIEELTVDNGFLELEKVKTGL
jgi:hypothetical protein